MTVQTTRREQHTCAECGEPFRQLDPRMIYCGEACKLTRDVRAKRAKRHSANPSTRPARALRSRVPRSCGVCGMDFVPTNPNGRYCSAACFAVRRRERQVGHYHALQAHHRVLARLSRYRMTRSEYDTLVARADGRCELCGSDGRLVIDHCHRTGKVRGLLCYPCNSHLAFVERPGRVEAARAYLAAHGGTA